MKLICENFPPRQDRELRPEEIEGEVIYPLFLAVHAFDMIPALPVITRVLRVCVCVSYQSSVRHLWSLIRIKMATSVTKTWASV